MSNRLYTGTVIVFWIASMTWLVTERIIPPFFGGDAPVTLVSSQIRPVAWKIEMDGRPCGQAVLQAVQGIGGTKEVHSVLKLDGVTAPKSVPLWLKPVLASLNSKLSLEMRTRTTYDSFDRLAAFDTDMVVNGLETKIEITGEIAAAELELTVRVGGLSKRFKHPWPSDAKLSGELTPAGRLLPLHEGRRWSHEVYSPFASPKAPLEMIEAVVNDKLRPTHDGVPTDAWQVEYRSMEKTGSTQKGRVRAVLLVSEDGLVLQQEVNFLGSKVLFVRENDERSVEVADELLQINDRATVYRTNQSTPDDEPTKPAAAAAGEESNDT